jgi:uncharacterized OsmC-like protein
MNTQQLRSIQAPLKEKYKKNPESALVTLKAQGKPGEGITCRLETGKALVEAGLHPATGGDGLSVCSGDMLLEALVACAGVTLMAVATSMEIKLNDALITAEGDLDFRGTLAVSKEVPVGFKNIRLKFDLDTEEQKDKIDKLIVLTERYCVVYQTLKNSPELNTSCNISRSAS